ncbi:ATP-dependent endonuclease [Aureispira sp. CCB-QB1]|uniref:ATP-dependent nuclease n=1 Tax=Aureispira sp. CCB-QB1 TaxID=1313421 RepID=UPI000698F63A|nr:AAA family ATPase [Aureispira sp. CCB-QB1]
MYLSKITIKGFRSFNEEGTTIAIKNKLNAFIGLNSSGKTAALDALIKIFGTGNNIYRQDFHIASKEDANNINEKFLSIEVKIEFSEEEKEAVPHFFNHMVIDGPNGEPYLRIRLESHWLKSNVSQEGEIDTNVYFIIAPEGGEETDDSKRTFDRRYRSLIQILYVPAIRKPSEQMKYVSGSILYRVLNLIKFSDTFKSEFENKIEGINGLFQGLNEFSKIQNALIKFWSKFHKDERYQDAKLGFGSSDLDSILKKMEVSFSPTGTHREFLVTDLGEGYRSLFYLTLVCTLLEVEEDLTNEDIDTIQPLLTILAIEEPENHIAPQLLGRVISILKSISEQKKSQVFLSSHTPAIIKRINPESIFHFRVNENYATEVNSIILPDKKDEAYKYIKEAIRNYPEIYFAKLAVIGEGDSEDVLFNRLMEVYDVDFDDNIISFIPLGHRFVNHIWKLLERLHIPYITLLDLDVGRNGGGWGRLKYAYKQLLEKGVPSKELLKIMTGKIITLDSLETMHTWTYIDNKLEGGILNWLPLLEKYNIFYSFPLDLDFLMLEHYSKFYKEAIPKGGGPQIPDKETEPDKFLAKVNGGVQATLKSEKAKGLTYSTEQKELMIWYNYHFLGRGKPSTHITALSLIDDETLKKNIPPVFVKIFNRIDKLLGR